MEFYVIDMSVQQGSNSWALEKSLRSQNNLEKEDTISKAQKFANEGIDVLIDAAKPAAKVGLALVVNEGVRCAEEKAKEFTKDPQTRGFMIFQQHLLSTSLCNK